VVEDTVVVAVTVLQIRHQPHPHLPVRQLPTPLDLPTGTSLVVLK